MFQTVVQKKEEYEVVYDISEVVEGLYLPGAYIVSLDKEGYLAHIKQRAMNETIGSFNLELTDVRKRLFDIIEVLQVKNLEKKFSPPRRKQKTLEQLLEDPAVKKTIFSFVHRRMDEFLSQVVNHQYPLTWNVQRKILVKDFLLELPQTRLHASLSFQRTEKEVLYQLQLANGSVPWKISTREVIPVTNHPAWLFVDHQLYKVANINGNMVKPFQQRDVVRIPEDKVRTYFQKFIVKVAAKQDIEAEGFDLVQYDKLSGCSLEVVRGLFDEQLVLALQMNYSHADFHWNDSKLMRTTLEFEEEDVRIIQVRRDKAAEERYIQKCERLGLKRIEGTGYFSVDHTSEDPFFLLEWLTRKREALQQEGFQIKETQLEDQRFYLKEAQLELKSDKTNDWFDIYGIVVVGDYEFPFLKLAKYIRDGNRFYPLPNGEVFLIPQEWMTKYRALVQFAQKSSKEQLRLNKSQFTILNEIGIDEERQFKANLEEVDFSPSSRLKATLRPYQLDGVKWLIQLYRNGLGGCLADDMGLGKTLQTITVLLHAKENKQREAEAAKPPAAEVATQLDLFQHHNADADFLQALNAIIILPASLVFNWESELAKFAPYLTVYKHTGPKRHKDVRLLCRFDIILTTYQTALRDQDFLKDMEYEYIILDESQQIKNRESKVFKAINGLEGRHKISLSGTPIENSLSDLWSQMQFINPNLLGSYPFFKKEFINPIEKQNDDDKKQQLRSLVNPYLLRRTKREVAKDLPPLTTKIFFTEMHGEQKKLYEKEKSAARNYLLENFDVNNPGYRILVLQSLTRLRQLVNHPRLVFPDYEKESSKFNDILEHWDVIRRSGHKALFFSSFVQYLDLFRKEFEAHTQEFAWLSGELSSNERVRQIKKFEEDERVQSFLISIKSGGSGLNLTAADYVFILDPWWNPTTEQQAIARAHRIGQEKNVIAVKFITRDSIEEKILQLQKRKSRLAGDIIETVNQGGFSRGDIEYLLD